MISCYDSRWTCLYNFDPLKPHFYIVKLGFTGVYIIFLISAQTIDCGYSLEPPRRGGSNEYPQSMFLSRNMKIIRVVLSKKIQFLEVKFSIYLNRRVFVMIEFIDLNGNVTKWQTTMSSDCICLSISGNSFAIVSKLDQGFYISFPISIP